MNMLIIFIVFSLYISITATLNPVLLIPGIGGSQLYGKISKEKVSPFYCEKNTGWYTLWFNLPAHLLRFRIECFVENIKLLYDSKSHKTRNPQGVEIKWSPPGTIKGMLNLDDYGIVTYFGYIVNRLKELGYQENGNLKGLSYDFRKAGNELQETVDILIKLIEDMYVENENESVCLVSHSMGGLIVLQMLETRSKEWKEKYIRDVVAIGVPYFGSVKSMQATISGYDFDATIIQSKKVRTAQRSYPSTAWLFPNPKFWNSSLPLVKTPKRAYNVNEYKNLYHDIGFMNGYEMYKDTEHILKFNPPGVPWHTVFGTGIKTPLQLIYNKLFPNSTPVIVEAEGDGTVDVHSSTGSTMWIGKQSEPLDFLAVNDAEHVALLKSNKVVNYIKKFL